VARIINVEKSQYTDSLIKTFAENRVGQYSKFLDKNFIFITYLHTNEAESRSDVGLGSVESDIGPNSPVRYDQINGLPICNVPELKPDLDYSENGYDIELDLSDITLLPNTVKPRVGDHIIISLPNMIELCFRINAFSYNTIQSNDFYMFSADLRFTGKDLINRFKGQIVEEWETIFENIGTEDKCFIQKKDVSKIQNAGKLINELLRHYYENFFDSFTGTFVCKNNTIDHEDAWLYDKYVEKFIMESQIYYRDNIEESIVLSCADIEQDMNRLYMETLYYAVLNRDASYLAPYPYEYQVGIQKSASPFVINDINCKGVNLLITRKKLQKGHSDALDNGDTMEYFSHKMIDLIKHPDHLKQEDPDGCQIIIFEGDQDYYKEYVGNPDAGTENCPVYYKPKIEKVCLTYPEKIVIEYLTGRMSDINKELLIPYTLRVDNYTYRMMPIIIYIITQYYESYFKSKQNDFL